MLNILQRRAAALDIEVIFETEVESLELYLGYDLVGGADGIYSPVRETYAEKFQPSVDVRTTSPLPGSSGAARCCFFSDARRINILLSLVDACSHCCPNLRP